MIGPKKCDKCKSEEKKVKKLNQCFHYIAPMMMPRAKVQRAKSAVGRCLSIKLTSAFGFLMIFPFLIMSLI